MKDHIMKGHEMKECYVCNQDLSELPWNSQFDSIHHYKTVKCNCGKLHRVKVSWSGSGHDNWSTKLKNVGASKFEVMVADEANKMDHSKKED